MQFVNIGHSTSCSPGSPFSYGWFMYQIVNYLAQRCGHKSIFRPTISKKICALFASALVVAVANIMVARFLLQDLNGVAETVNVAGKLRMLSQKIAFLSTKALYEPLSAAQPLQ